MLGLLRGLSAGNFPVLCTCLELVLSALAVHPADPDIQTEGFRILAGCTQASADVAVRGMYTVSLLPWPRTRHAFGFFSGERVYSDCLLVFYSHCIPQAMLLSSPGIDLVYTALEMHADSIDVFNASLAVLTGLTFHYEQLDSQLASSSVIDTLLGVIWRVVGDDDSGEEDTVETEETVATAACGQGVIAVYPDVYPLSVNDAFQTCSFIV